MENLIIENTGNPPLWLSIIFITLLTIFRTSISTTYQKIKSAVKEIYSQTTIYQKVSFVIFILWIPVLPDNFLVLNIYPVIAAIFIGIILNKKK